VTSKCTSYLFAAIAILAVAFPARAVVVDLQLTGQPEPCTILLDQGGKQQRVTTDTTGHAKIDVNPSQPVRIETKNTDYARTPVYENVPTAGKTIEIPVQPSAPLVQIPQ
jgi:hypothetical protein